MAVANVNQATTYSGAAPVAAVFVAPTDPLPDNCVAVAMKNPNVPGAVDALFGNGAVGAAAVEGVNCARLQVGDSFTLPIGPLSERGLAYTLNYASVGGAIQIDLVYLNSLSQPL
jgi:hypothetical protein